MRRNPWKSRLIVLLLFCCSLVMSLAIAKVSVARTPAMELVEQARSLYLKRDYQNAVNVWQEVATIFAEENDALNQGMALSNLALTYQQLGQWQQGKIAIDRSLAILQQQEHSPELERILASSLEIKGKLQLAIGERELALDSWQAATNIYRNLEDRQAVTRSQINQAQIMQNLGLYPKACRTIVNALDLSVKECEVTLEALQQWETQEDTPKNISGLVSLGNILRVMGENDRSQAVLLTAARLGKQNKVNLAGVYLALGNTASFLARENTYFTRGNNRRGINAVDYEELVTNYWSDAEKYYHRAIANADNPLTMLQGKANLLNLLVQNQRGIPANLITEIQSLLISLPPTPEKITARINFTRSLLELPLSEIQTINVVETINSAIAEAQTLGDNRDLAFAVAILGKYYELQQQWQLAAETTKRALNYTIGNRDRDIAAELFWQLGRIEKARGQRQNAIGSYTQAYDLMQSLRTDLVGTNPNTQFAFRDRIEPVYRELVELLLAPDIEPSQAELVQARQAIESLQLAELDNFFSEACIKADKVQIDKIAPNSAVIYSILLENRLEVIISLPNGTLIHQSNNIDIPIERIIGELRRNIALENYATLASRSSALEAMKSERNNPSRGIEILRTENAPQIDNWQASSQQLYDWLIAPFTEELEKNQVDTLVFVLDGVLRNIPMTILQDGEQYLIEKYAVVLTPGMQLLEPEPLSRKKLTTLTAGLSQQSPQFQDFPPLPNVKQELASIEASIDSKTLLDKSFTEKNLAAKIDNTPFPIVHIATHGKFSSLAKETYILAWDDTIDATELNLVLQGKARSNRPIELLVLSACQTALGDERAVLGLAGVAMRGGAKSTLASLWLVNDESTALLMEKFYQALASGNISKAEALRQAQVALLKSAKFNDPYFWSAFVLVGNWL